MATPRKNVVDPADLPGGANWQVQIPANGAQPNPPQLSGVDEMPEDFEETAADRVMALLSGAGSDATAKISLYRLPTAGRKMAWLDEMTPEDFERGGLKMISERWGAGEYEIRLYAMRPEVGTFGIRRRTQVSIELAKTPTVSTSGGNSEVAAMLKAMSDQQEALLRTLAENRPAPVDPMAQMTQMLTMMKLMREATGADDRPKKTELMELVEAMRTMKEVSGEFNPEKDAEPSMLSMAGPIIEMIKGSMDQRNAAQQLQPFPTVALPPSITQPAPLADAQSSDAIPLEAQSNQESPQDVNALQLLIVKGYFSALVKMAVENKPHGDGAQFVVDKIPDEIVDLMELDTWFELLEKVEPAVTQHREWLTAVRDEAIKRLYTAPES